METYQKIQLRQPKPQQASRKLDSMVICVVVYNFYLLVDLPINSLDGLEKLE